MKDLDGIAATGVAAKIPLGDVLYMANKANRIAPLQVVRADRVMGLDHLQSAWTHAERSLREGRNQAKRPELEFLRYMACCKTIDEALGRMGLPDPVDGAIVCAMGENRRKAIPYFVEHLGYDEDDSLLEGSPDAPAALGIGPEVLAKYAGREADLVLQAIAEVDTLK